MTGEQAIAYGLVDAVLHKRGQAGVPERIGSQ